VRILHISDFHLPDERGQILYGLDPYACVQAAVAAVGRVFPVPDLAVVGGDMLNAGESGDYGTLNDVLVPLSMPIHYVLGNHDCLDVFNESSLSLRGAESPGYYSCDCHGCHLVMLYTAGTGHGYGEMDDEQLAWLEKDLVGSSDRPVLIFAHHPPVDVGVAWLDRIKLHNADAFWRVVEPHAVHILGVFVAHLHLQATWVHRGVFVASCPSVCWQFSGNADAAKAELSDEPPGFNVIDVSDEQVVVRTVHHQL